jgi:oligo-1,6-glucosidase
MRKNLNELLRQPYAIDTLESMGKLKPASEWTDDEVCSLEPLWKNVEATALPIHIPICGEYERKWWKEAVIYQIYPMSFCDSNGDGIGDLNGIISKLDYLKELGIDVVWLSPIYDSPNDDNGYDIRDYQKIQADYGTMEDFDRLLDEVHKRGMRLIMDMVLNHTSDEHRWFQEALSNPSSKYKDYYIWRKGDSETPPNNWTSFFSGSAWKYFPEVGEWALHIFSSKQMDLNWENPELRKEIYKMLNWWLKKGVDGFRLDVINLISKFDGLPDGIPGGFVTGIENYVYGPRMHQYLHEMNREAFSKYDSYTVGEGCGLGARTQVSMTLASRQELNTTFCFSHFDTPGHNKYDIYRYDLNHLKNFFINTQSIQDADNWLTIVFDNHDNPRFLSKITRIRSEEPYAAKLIALLEMTLSGTAFLFEGQELGMNHVEFSDASEFRDVEAINLYHELISKGKSPAEAFKYVAPGTRDQSRAPMQWDSSKNGGFTTGTPWLRLNNNYGTINAETESADPDSVLSFYRSAITLRKKYSTLVYGSFSAVRSDIENFFGYVREDKYGRYYVEINLTDSNIERPATADGELLLSNYRAPESSLRPFEANLYKIR